MKKIIIFLLIFIITGCRNTNSILFKEEYEVLNGNKNYQKVSVPTNNPFVYITDEELVNKIEKHESMIVYFGYSKNNNCRIIVNNLLEVSKELKIDKIYYLDILNIRDTKEILNDEIIVKEEGSSYYNNLLELLNNSLMDYVIDNKVVGKRIYAPNILVIKDDVIFPIESCLDNSNDSSEDIKNRVKNLLQNYLN